MISGFQNYLINKSKSKVNVKKNPRTVQKFNSEGHYKDNRCSICPYTYYITLINYVLTKKEHMLEIDVTFCHTTCRTVLLSVKHTWNANLLFLWVIPETSDEKQNISQTCNLHQRYRNNIIYGGVMISFNHLWVCLIELSNPSCLTVVCKRGSVEFTDTVRQRGLESSLRHTQGDWNFFLHICFI